MKAQFSTLTAVGFLLSTVALPSAPPQKQSVGDFGKDPSIPANYNWTLTDAVVEEIRATGLEAVFRFGESWPSDATLEAGEALNYIPPDPVSSMPGTFAMNFSSPSALIVGVQSNMRLCSVVGTDSSPSAAMLMTRSGVPQVLSPPGVEWL